MRVGPPQLERREGVSNLQMRSSMSLKTHKLIPFVSELFSQLQGDALTICNLERSLGLSSVTKLSRDQV